MTPDVSLIFSTRNRERLLEQTLAGLAAQDRPGIDWEIIVVDNGSSDRTAEVLRRWQARLPLTVLQEPVPGKCRALNRALGVVRGALVVFTDDDIIPDRRWISELVGGAARWPDDGIFGGKIVPRFPAGGPEFLKADEFRYADVAYSRFTPRGAEGPVTAIPFGPNFAVRRQALGDGRFDERLGPSAGSYIMGDETEFLMRLRGSAERYIYLPQAAVEHVIEPHQFRLKWLLRRAVMCQRGLVRLGLQGDAQYVGPTWFSVPRYFWREFLGRIATLGRACFRGKRRRWEAAMDVGTMIGTIREQRAMALEAAETKVLTTHTESGLQAKA